MLSLPFNSLCVGHFPYKFPTQKGYIIIMVKVEYFTVHKKFIALQYHNSLGPESLEQYISTWQHAVAWYDKTH